MNTHRWQPLEIVGGGIAGLALGSALHRAGLPVTVFETLGYPRHRVCGEFIAGLDDATTARLGLGPLLQDARRHRRVVWRRHGRTVREHDLPAPALGLSRYALDARLAGAFVDAGGELRTSIRVPIDSAPEGRVFAVGRRRQPSPWLGLKVHVRGLCLAGDLEVHLGDQGYVGLSGVEDCRVNVCGLFRRRRFSAGEPAATGVALLLRYLDAAGLEELGRRLRAAEIDAGSFCAVAALPFHRQAPTPGRLCIGDSFAMPPPFTGNGMAMALQGAALACDPLIAWARGTTSWPDAIEIIQRRLRRHFRLRLACAQAVHSFLLEPPRQWWLAAAGRLRLLPLRPLYHLTH